jgi:diguanylate cyclase (GGDEF)-like protein
MLQTLRRNGGSALLGGFGLVGVCLMQFVLYMDQPPFLRAIQTLTVALYVIFAVLTYELSQRDLRARVLVWFCVFTIGTYLLYPFPPGGHGLLRTVYAGLYCVVYFGCAALLSHFGLAVATDGEPGKLARRAIACNYMACLALIAIGTFAIWNASSHIVASLPGELSAAQHLLRKMVLAFYMVAALAVVTSAGYAGLRSRSTAMKRQTFALCAGVLPWGILRAAATLAPSIGAAPTYNATETFVIFMLPVGLFLAVHGFELFGFDTRLRRSVLITVTVGFLCGIAYVSILNLALVLDRSVTSLWIPALGCLVAAVLLRVVLTRLGGALDTIFFPERIALRNMAETIVTRVAQHTDLRVLTSSFVSGIRDGLGLEWAAIYVLNDSGAAFEWSAQAGDAQLQPRISAAEALKEDFVAGPREQLMRIELGGHMNALLRIGPRRSGEGLSGDQLREIRLVAIQVAAMIENARLFAIATRDPLTGLYRRPFFEEHLASECARTARYHSPFALIMLDLDDFKKVNDVYGHSAGDEVLRRVGELLRSLCRDVDIAARYGGEELIMLLPNTPLEGAVKVAENVRRALAELVVEACRQQLSVTASIGVAAAEQNATPSDLLERADQCLYRAKRAGKNRVEAAGLEKAARA